MELELGLGFRVRGSGGAFCLSDISSSQNSANFPIHCFWFVAFTGITWKSWNRGENPPPPPSPPRCVDVIGGLVSSTLIKIFFRIGRPHGRYLWTCSPLGIDFMYCILGIMKRMDLLTTRHRFHVLHSGNNEENTPPVHASLFTKTCQIKMQAVPWHAGFGAIYKDPASSHYRAA